MDIIIRCLTLIAIISLSIQFSLSSQSIPKVQQIPSILKQCHKNDPNLTECLRRAIEAIRVNLSTGIPELLIPPCEPLRISEIRIKQNAGAIRMDSEYSNIVISGLSNFTLRDIHVDTKMNSVRADLWFPVLEMTSNYMLQGKVLLMPLAGSGTASGNFTDVDATLIMKKRNNSENEQYDNKRLGDIHVEFNIGSASIRLDNLFNGDPELGSMMNKFLNNNWREITAEIRPALGESIEHILYGIATQLNDKYGLEQILE